MRKRSEIRLETEQQVGGEDSERQKISETIKHVAENDWDDPHL